MNFSSDAMADFEGLLAVNREICMMQMAEKTSPDAPPNCAVVPLVRERHNVRILACAARNANPVLLRRKAVVQRN